MQIKLANKTLNLPDEIYLDQLVQLDLGLLEQMESLSQSKNLNDTMKMLKWFLDFFKVIGIKERLGVNDFQELQKENQLMNWFQGLFQGFQTSR